MYRGETLYILSERTGSKDMFVSVYLLTTVTKKSIAKMVDIYQQSF